MAEVTRSLREGLIAGVIGAGGVAIWFLIVDTIGGHPFYTPSLLGSAVFWGLRDPSLVQVSFPAVIGYTMIHCLAFWVVGTIGAFLTALVDRMPSTLFLIVVFFAVFEIGFILLLVLVAAPLLKAIAYSNIAMGNLIAALGMGYYLWRSHPHIREALAAHPLGETDDGE